MKIIQRLLIAGFLAMAPVSAWAASGATTVQANDAGSVARTFNVFSSTGAVTGNLSWMNTICDFTTTTNCATVDAQHGLLVGGEGVAGTPAGGVVSVQGVASGTTLPVTAAQGTAANLNATVVGTGTFATQSAITAASASIASGAIASGAVASGAVASGAFASGSLAVGSGTDGWNVTEGTKGDAAYTTGSGTMVSVLKGIYTNTGAAIPAGTNSIGTVVQPVLSHASVTSLGTSLAAKASAGDLYGYNCTAITGGAAGYCIAYNATSAPSTGALTGALVLDSCYFDTTARGCSLSHVNGSIAFSTGIVILVTSAVTPFTYTTGTDTAYVSADYQ